MSSGRLQRKIGLGGAVFLLVGHIVGASIFILPGQLAGEAGPAVFLAYLIASIPAIVNCLIAAQVGSILPVSAGDYVFTSLALHPLLGFLKVWSGMLSLIVSVPILAFGFADYMAFFVPEVPRLVIALGIVLGGGNGELAWAPGERSGSDGHGQRFCGGASRFRPRRPVPHQ